MNTNNPINNLPNSETITPTNIKSSNKYNLNNLNLSLINSVENSSYILLKDGTIKQKRHKNSYVEEYLDNKRLLKAIEADSKIRRVKSCVNDNKKKNLFYKANFYFDSNEKNSEKNIENISKLQRNNMYENVFIDDNLNDFNNLENNRFSHNNYYNNLNLNFYYNDIIKPSKNSKNKKVSKCNCNKYDSKSNCKYDKNSNKNNSNKNGGFKFRNLSKYLNKIENKKNDSQASHSYTNTLNKKDKNNMKNIFYNLDKFNLTFKSTSKENGSLEATNQNKYSNNNLKIINNEKMQYKSITSNNNKNNNKNNTPNNNRTKNKDSYEQCRINTKNTNFVSKIISDKLSPIKQSTKQNINYSINENNTNKNSIESIFNLSIMNKNKK